jgi:histidinol phosphatase-like PHP family hydrolase
LAPKRGKVRGAIKQTVGEWLFSYLRRIRGLASLKDVRNSDIAELLARAAEHAKQPLQRALRRAARRSFLWPDEAEDMLARGQSLTELAGIGPYLNKQIIEWLKRPPELEGAIPEIRQNFLTLAEARTLRSKYPERFTEIRGDLQMHTLWSDGSGSVQDMAEAARSRGYSYIAITDHSKGLKIAGGIDEDQLAHQAEEIAAINESMRGNAGGFRVLRSVELNLSPSGAGDMDQAALDRLDLVLGCFHSALRRKDDQTERYLAALRDPSIHILGHPRGRIYNFRLGLSADWARVFALAAELDKAVEIDCYPDRQDLSIDLLAIARKEGCRISMGTDSHGPSQLEFMDLGVAAAIRANLDPKRILNYMPTDELLEWAKSVRHS